MRHANERGIAMILALFMVLAVSVVGASVMFVSHTETVSSQNYRSMSQARYGAESGIHHAINYLLNSYSAPNDHIGSTDPLTAYVTTTSPVTAGGQPVMLSSLSSVTANYPITATKTSFQNTVKGTLDMGGIPVTYGAAAKLLSMRKIFEYGSAAGNETTVQTWLITGSASIAGEQTATVEVTATLERQIIKTSTFAAFATAATCGALSFGGGGVTNSYDSSNMTLVSGVPDTTASTGNVGTNGNLTINGNAAINGSLSTPKTGVGNCANGSPDAVTMSNNGSLTGGIIPLPQTLVYPAPITANPIGGTATIASNQTCSAIGLTAPQCVITTSGGVTTWTLNPNGGSIALGKTSVSGVTLKLEPGTYNIDTLKLTNTSSKLVIDTTASSDQVIMNITDTSDNSPLDLTGGGVSNSSFISYNFRIQYGGTHQLQMAGGAANASLLYAPSAPLKMTGGSDYYGALLAKTIDDSGGTSFHYDRRLNKDAESAGNFMLSAFSWQSYP